MSTANRDKSLVELKSQYEKDLLSYGKDWLNEIRFGVPKKMCKEDYMKFLFVYDALNRLGTVCDVKEGERKVEHFLI